jgi:subtilisin family serine protease
MNRVLDTRGAHRRTTMRIFLLLLAAALTAAPAMARDEGAGNGADARPAGLQRYVIELRDPPLPLYDGGDLSAEVAGRPMRLEATARRVTRERKLDVQSDRSAAYLAYLSTRQDEFHAEVAKRVGRDVPVVSRLRNAVNAMVLDLTEAEAAELARSPRVKSIRLDRRYRLDTFAGPKWLGSADIWTGDAGNVPARGEGIIVAVIDTGINWDSPSFSRDTQDGYTHENPLGVLKGLCSQLEVGCNAKLIGVYDFVEDDPSTEDVVEENTNGKDNNGHGSHTASIAAGNPVDLLLEGGIAVTLSGVAPRANIISYRVCYQGEPHTEDSEGCAGSAILQAIDQAIADGVDVINYSIGGDAGNPWQFGSEDLAFLSARAAGIFIASSAGNSGPNEQTVSSPASAPWVIAVGNATHNAILGNSVRDFTGGVEPPERELVGASLTGGTGRLVVVHARDYGFPLCGVGEPELQPTCDSNLGLSNPWAGERPFNGEIVVCDRGTYGRVEKGKNVLQAGAGGYILANTEDWGETIVADEHCLPATHLGYEDGEVIRNWLAEGVGHGASLSGLMLAERDLSADILSISSARGPSKPPVEGVMKPNLIAPGTNIFGAFYEDSDYVPLSGTSMAAPHIAGAAALLRSAHPGWTPSQLASVIETTATRELARNDDGSPATVNDAGAGRPQLGEAINAGLYLEVTASDFQSANPGIGGEPRNLNLPGLIDPACKGSCTFTRTVTDQMGGGSWTAEPVGFPAGVAVTVGPSSFNLASGASRQLTIEVNLDHTPVIGDWLSGNIRLSSPGAPDQFLTVSVYSDGGNLPASWTVSDGRDGGWKEFTLSGLVELPDATFSVGGLVKPARTDEILPQDPTDGDPYDGGDGVFTRWMNLPQGALWIYTEITDSEAQDIDLFVGRDDNGNGRADEFEELCASTTPDIFEHCDLFDQPPGDYWILVQNWEATNVDGDAVTMLSAGISAGDEWSLAASGPGRAGAGEVFPVRLSWDNLSALPGETWLGAVGVGHVRDQPNSIGVIPVRFNRLSIPVPETYPLVEGREHYLALAGNSKHDRIFIDVPPGASSLTVFTGAADEQQSNGLTLTLKRLSYEDGLASPPFATAVGDREGLATADGAGGQGPSIAIQNIEPGRYYAELANNNSTASSVAIRAEVEFDGQPVAIHRGLWEPSSRPDLGQGFDFNWGSEDRALIWYTYDEAGQPAWYIAGNLSTSDHIWTADLLRVTNDGTQQQMAPVGYVTVTSLAENDTLFSYTLFGRSGTERMKPLSRLTCPQVDGAQKSYTGIWFRGVDGLGGASILTNSETQAQIHYLFDDSGLPRWLFAQDLESPAPTNTELPILQYSGSCAVCQVVTPSYVEVGVLQRTFDSETTGSWTLNYLMDSPLSGSVERTDSIVKLTDTLGCE